MWTETAGEGFVKEVGLKDDFSLGREKMAEFQPRWRYKGGTYVPETEKGHCI